MSDEELAKKLHSGGLVRQYEVADARRVITDHLKSERQAVKGLVEGLERIKRKDYTGTYIYEGAGQIAASTLADYRATGKVDNE